LTRGAASYSLTCKGGWKRCVGVLRFVGGERASTHVSVSVSVSGFSPASSLPPVIGARPLVDRGRSAVGNRMPSTPSPEPRFRVVQPPHFERPRGFVNGIVARGRTLWIAGQVGWEREGVFASSELPAQFARALDHILDIVREAGGGPEDIVNMTIYVTDLPAYKNGVKEIGAAWRQKMGRHYPAMALVGVAGLVEDGAKVEIQAQAVLAD